jgi:AbrB family looped-hinge helix DNA binding protein
MEKKGVIDIVVRPKRQVTLPREICEQLGISPGDKLELVADGNHLVARPKKMVALEALREIRETFKRCGITEEELQESGRRVRQQLAKGRHAEKV